MPSKSKAQQKFMGMVHALQKGDMKPSDASTSVKKAAQSMKKSDAKDYASTSHKGLPRKVKQEILNKLKEYANKMGTNTMGGDDYTSSKKGGLRDFDGYDNVDYNKDMPMDEGMFSAIDHIRQNSKSVRDFIKNVLSDKDFRDMKSDKDFIKYLGSIYEGVTEGGIPQNWMSGRTSDYHTKLRGKKRKYDDSNFDKENSGQPDLEEATKPDYNSKGFKEANKLVAKLRSSIFKKMNDNDLDQFRMVLAQSFDLKESLSHNEKEMVTGIIDILKQVKDTDNRKEIALKMIRQFKEENIDFDYSKFLNALKEYGSRLTDPYLLPKDEDKLKGTPPSKDTIDRELDEEAKRDYKAEYKKFQSSTKAKKYRAELNKYNRQKGTYGNGDGKDASHKGGKIVGFETESKNRGRREKSRLKKK